MATSLQADLSFDKAPVGTRRGPDLRDLKAPGLRVDGAMILLHLQAE